METLITQKFTFATITPYKDYSKLSDKKSSLNTFELNEVDVYDPNIEDYIRGVFTKDITGRTYSLPDKLSYHKRKLNFFYDNTEVHETFKIEYTYKNVKSDFSFDTTKDHQIKRHFGRPFSSIGIQTIERSIRKFGDKVTIKIYHGYKKYGF